MSYSISAFEKVWHSALSDNHVGCFLTCLAEDNLMSHGTKKIDKNYRHPYTTSASVKLSQASLTNWIRFGKKLTATKHPNHTKKNPMKTKNQ